MRRTIAPLFLAVVAAGCESYEPYSPPRGPTVGPPPVTIGDPPRVAPPPTSPRPLPPSVPSTLVASGLAKVRDTYHTVRMVRCDLYETSREELARIQGFDPSDPAGNFQIYIEQNTNEERGVLVLGGWQYDCALTHSSLGDEIQVLCADPNQVLGPMEITIVLDP